MERAPEHPSPATERRSPAREHSPAPDDLAPATLAVTAGRPTRTPGAPVNEPISMSSTFVADGQRSYARAANASWEAFEDAVGALEGGEAVAFASGLAAVGATLADLDAGSRVVVPQHAYAGTQQLLDAHARRRRLSVERLDPARPDAFAAASVGAALVWLESPTNPTMEVIDLRAAAEAAHAAGALVVVDNTFATPLLQRPLDLGADIVVHSASKYLAGHSDLVLGVAVARDPQRVEQLRDDRTLGGAIAGSFEAFLALRGVRTLDVRLQRAQASAQVIAERLAEHPRVAEVRYPGLPTDPGHATARRQMRGFGAMLAFEHAGGADEAEATCARTRLWTHATSLGGVESTLERRRRWDNEPDTVPAALVRLSVGCEDVEDLWRDLAAAL